MFKKILALLLFTFFFTPLTTNAQSATNSQAGFPVIDTSLLPPPPSNPPDDMALPTGLPHGLQVEPASTTKSRVNLSNVPVTTSVGSVATTPIYIKEIKLEKDTYKAGETVHGDAYLSSTQPVDQLDVYLDISLGGDYKNVSKSFGIPTTLYGTQFVGPFIAKKEVTVKIPFSYVLPSGIGGKGLGINVVARLKSGLILYMNNAFLKEITGGSSLLDIKEASVEVDSKKFAIQAGPTVYPDSKAFFNITLSNPTKNVENLKSVVKVFDRTISGQFVTEGEENPIMIKAGETIKVKVKIPSTGIRAGVYETSFDLVDQEGQSKISRTTFRYIIPGASAVIQGLNFEAKTVNKGDTVNVALGYSGPAMDINTGKPQTITGATLTVKIYDPSTNQVIGQESSPAVFDKELTSTMVAVKIDKSSNTIKVVASITDKNNNVIALYESSPTEADLTKLKEAEVSPEGADYLKFAEIFTLVILIVLLILLVKNRSRNSVILSVMITFAVVGSGLLSYTPTEALVYSADYWGWGYANGSPVFTNPTRQYLTRGDTVTVSGYFVDQRCYNIPEYVQIYTSFFGATGPAISPWGLVYNYLELTDFHVVGTNNHWFASPGYSTSGLATGTYYWLGVYYEAQTGSDGDFSVLTGQRSDIYWISFWLYERVNVTCSADKTTAYVGDTVKWTMVTTGGTNHYHYYWYNPTDQAGWENSPQVMILSKTYNATGTKNMFAAIVDDYTTNNSNVNNGGNWKQCSNTVLISASTTAAVVPAIVQSCAPSATTVAVNTPVTWTLSASGGTAPLKYYLGDSSGTTSSNTITRTYTTAGTMNMSYLASDVNTPVNTPTMQCPTVTVTAVQNLNCTSPAGGAIANGSTVRMYANATSACGTYVDFTCTNGTLSAGDQTLYKNAQCVDSSSPVISSFKVIPDTVNKGSPCFMPLKVSSSQACSILGTNGENISVGLDASGNSSTTLQSAGLTISSKYTLSCTGKTKDASGNYPVVTKSGRCFLNAATTEK
ncbi:MAG: hypothetical protein WCG97_00140 [bacterium]